MCGLFAKGLYISNTGGIEIDVGGTRCLSSRNGGEALVVEGVFQNAIVTKSASSQGSYKNLFIFKQFHSKN